MSSNGPSSTTQIGIVVAMSCCSSMAIALFLWYAYRNQSKFKWLDWFFDFFNGDDDDDESEPAPQDSPSLVVVDNPVPAPATCPQSKDNTCTEDSTNCGDQAVKNFCAHSCKKKCKKVGNLNYTSKKGPNADGCFLWKQTKTCKEAFSAMDAGTPVALNEGM